MAALRLSSFVVLSLAIWGMRHASAEPTDDKARALELARAGDQAYKAGEFEKAADLVRQAYALYPEPTLLYNLALALDGMGSTEEAVGYYEQYLATNPAVKDRGAIERRVANMRQQLERKAAELEQQRQARDGVVRDGSSTRQPPAPASKLPFVTIGVGVAAVGVGFGFGIASAARHDDAETAPNQIEVQAMQDRAQRYATTANVLFVAGGAIVVGGTIWAVLDYRRRRDTEPAPGHARLLLGPSSVGLAWALP